MAILQPSPPETAGLGCFQSLLLLLPTPFGLLPLWFSCATRPAVGESTCPHLDTQPCQSFSFLRISVLANPAQPTQTHPIPRNISTPALCPRCAHACRLFARSSERVGRLAASCSLSHPPTSHISHAPYLRPYILIRPTHGPRKRNDTGHHHRPNTLSTGGRTHPLA